MITPSQLVGCSHLKVLGPYAGSLVLISTGMGDHVVLCVDAGVRTWAALTKEQAKEVGEKLLAAAATIGGGET